MRKIMMMLIAGSILAACNQQTEKQAVTDNPFFQDYGTPFEAPDFDRIEVKHFLPAFEKGIAEAQATVNQIADNPEPPTFENTLVALEQSEALLDRVRAVFDNLTSAHTNDSLTAIDKEVAPLLAKLKDDRLLNTRLFQRVKTLYEGKDQLNLNQEQLRLLENYYKEFVRGGANLDSEKQAQLREINQELSLLSIQFSENVRKEDYGFELVIDDEEKLDGLPENVISAAAETARDTGKDGNWVFTLQKPSMIPFLQYSRERDLRKQIYQAYLKRGDQGNEFDNKENLKKIVNLRIRKAQLLGYENYSAYVLEERMAGNSANVDELLNKIWEPALEMAQRESAQMQKMLAADGFSGPLESWDWWYYAERIREQDYSLNEEAIRPFFQLEKVRQGAFTVANKLFGITFEKREDLPVYHPDVETFEVKDPEGKTIGLFYTDYFPRESKRGGAWMSEYRGQSNLGGKEVLPIVVNVCNFTPPTAGKPALLSFEEVITLFHEFGHGLHGLLSQVQYPKLSGTSVARDFVEFPSQIMENWASDPVVMKMYAAHYETGETIPDDLITKLMNSSKFNQGFATVEYLAASLLDMKWHSLTEQFDGDVNQFENSVLREIGLIPQIESRYRSTYFRHIFASGYASGYYSYIWSGVLDSDGYAYFKETNLFDPEKAEKLKKYVYAAGGTDDAMNLYKKFRGSEPSIDALLEKRGLNEVQELRKI